MPRVAFLVFREGNSGGAAWRDAGRALLEFCSAGLGHAKPGWHRGPWAGRAGTDVEVENLRRNGERAAGIRDVDDAANAPFATTWTMTRSPQDAPDREEQVTIGFEQGVPVSVGGMKLPPVQLVELLNEIGARNAIGRIDLVENRFVGIKSRVLR